MEEQLPQAQGVAAGALIAARRIDDEAVLQEGDERTALLSARGVTVQIKAVLDGGEEGRMASPKWIIPAYFAFSLLAGASVSVEMEILSQLACRSVAASDKAFAPPLMLLNKFAELFGAAETPDADWAARCRASPVVQRRTTEIITSIMLASGILSAMTCGWWGGLSDRKGRKPVLAVTSAVELVLALIMLLVVALPATFGYKTLIAGAVLSGAAGGQLNGITIGAAYLGDCALDGSKTQLLGMYEAVTYLGLGLGPMLGALLVRSSSYAVFAIYIAQIAARAVYLLLVPFIPESLPPRRRTHQLEEQPEEPSSAKATGEGFVVRMLKVPAELLKPFAVLLPREVVDAKGHKWRDWRLTLLSASYTFAMIVPGMTAVKVLYARAKFGWGPAETGRWVTLSALCRVVVLLVIVPLVARKLRKPAPSPPPPRSDGRDGSAAQEEWNARGAVTLKRTSDTAFDLSLARTSSLITLVGYLVFATPPPSSSASRNYWVGTALTASSAATIPALQSLALAVSAPDDAGKVLACVSALATVSASTVGPSLFGAVFVLSVERWAELVFVVAAVWVGLSTLPLFMVRLGGTTQDEEEHQE
ncbi:hypothetical protein JCM5296_006981 [Sporobolomyces johnsonii]